jgi:hypothetical protein
MLKRVALPVVASAFAVALFCPLNAASQVGVGVCAGTAVPHVGRVATRVSEGVPLNSPRKRHTTSLWRKPQVSVSMTVGKRGTSRRGLYSRLSPTLSRRTCVIGKCPPSCRVGVTMVASRRPSVSY